MNKEQLKLERDKNYEKWFKRWADRHGLDEQIRIANKRNYTCLTITARDMESERDRKMMKDNKFVFMLKERFSSFTVTREVKDVERFLLGKKLGEIEIDRVYIDWGM